jgi:hypothetical protein
MKDVSFTYESLRGGFDDPSKMLYQNVTVAVSLLFSICAEAVYDGAASRASPRFHREDSAAGKS